LIGLVDEGCQQAIDGQQLGSNCQPEPVTCFAYFFERNPGFVDKVCWAFRPSRFLLVGTSRRSTPLQLLDDGLASGLLGELRKQFDDRSSQVEQPVGNVVTLSMRTRSVFRVRILLPSS
jgi:hypothetical protein